MATGTLSNDLQPALSTVQEVVASTPKPFAELGLGVLVLIVVITFHGWAMARVNGLFNSEIARLGDHTPDWRYSLLTAVGIGLLTATHLIETLIWSVPILGMGILGSLRDTYYFVLESYTTLGESTVTLPEVWRLGGPIIAISGLFTFSWTGSVLVYVVTETGRRHSHNGQRKSSPSKSKDHDATT